MVDPAPLTPNGQPPHLPPARLGRTLRLGLRSAWDGLGLVCGASLTIFCAASIPLALVARAGALPAGPAQAAAAAAALLGWFLMVPPLYAGTCVVAFQQQAFEETAYGDVWRGARRLYGRAVALGATQALITAALAANAVFYLTRGSVPIGLLGVVFVYALAFWLVTCSYHWPLLAAADAGVPARDDGRVPGVRATLRNAFLMTVSAPGYSLFLALTLVVTGAALTASGIGLALVLPGLAAFVTTRAARDQLVRFGAVPAPPDPEAPVEDPGWRA